MTDTFALRFATVDDIPTILHHRRSMFAEMRVSTTEMLDRMMEPFTEWLRPRLESGSYLGFFLTDGEVVAAGGGLWLMEWPPGPLDLLDRRGYIMNVYTEPGYRSQGLARRLVTEMMDYSRAHGLNTALLHASDAGYPIYTSIGFKRTMEMRFPLHNGDTP
jgi:ribosomal protein S18 acetylase RimI-like enzyme